MLRKRRSRLVPYLLISLAALGFTCSACALSGAVWKVGIDGKCNLDMCRVGVRVNDWHIGAGGFIDVGPVEPEEDDAAAAAQP